MIKVLHVLNGLNNGGAETFIMNILRSMDRTKVQFDFLLRTTQNNNILIEECEKMGCKIYYTSSFPKHFYQNYKEVFSILKRSNYNVIHVHANALIYITPFIITRKLRISNSILHSHSTKTDKGYFALILHKINRLFLKKLVTNYLSCSNEAGKWMFGNSNFNVLNNAVDTQKMRYDLLCRNKMREELQLLDKFVIGHIGRFVQAKNHVFLIDIFYSYYKNNANAILLLLGTGELKSNIEQKVHSLGLEKNVIFLGQCTEINKYLNAMDILIFPSLFEGLPFTLVEAQATGLPILASDQISEKVRITDLIRMKSLDDTAEEWSDCIDSISTCNDRIKYADIVELQGFGIQSVKEKLMNIYLAAKE